MNLSAPRPMVHNFALSLLGALLLCAGCTGGIMEPAGWEPAEGPRDDDMPSDNLPNFRDEVEAPPAVEENAPPPMGVGQPGDTGTVVVRRLSRYEYNATVRDLLGTAQRPASSFPEDDQGFGFDNIAKVLTTSATHIEAYERAADLLLSELFERRGAGDAAPPGEALQVEAETLDGVGAPYGSAWNLHSMGSIAAHFDLVTSGSHRVEVRAFQHAAGDEDARMRVTLNGVSVGEFSVGASEAAPEIYGGSVDVPAGRREVRIEFLNDYYVAGSADRNVLIDWIRVTPPSSAPPPATPDSVLTCGERTPACRSEILAGFTRRAWRRPATSAELAQLEALAANAEGLGASWDDSLKAAMTSVLISPFFIYRVELDDAPSSPTVHRLNAHELATRLSYFLWSSMPDERLDSLADNGSLLNDDVLIGEVVRMLDDPKASALIDNFVAQWLQLRDLETHDLGSEHPEFTERLRSAMRTETELFMRRFLESELPVSEMANAEFTYLDAELADHYGLPGGSATFSEVSTAGDDRTGILGHGSVLAITSGTETSPVKRGVWVLTNLLCQKPPAPPPGVESAEDNAPEGSTTSERLAAHRENPACSGCHDTFDGLGLALEHYDPVGLYRETDQHGAVDASGELNRGEITFYGMSELADVIAADIRFPRCVTNRLMTYALGRGIENRADHQWTAFIAQEALAEGGSLRDIILGIVLSEPFRMRRGGAE